MTNKEFIYTQQKDIERKWLILKKLPDSQGLQEFRELLFLIVAQKFRLHYPGSLFSNDYRNRNEIWYSWYIVFTNSIYSNFYNLNTTIQKLNVLQDCINSEDIVKWCFNNIKSKY